MSIGTLGLGIDGAILADGGAAVAVSDVDGELPRRVVLR